MGLVVVVLLTGPVSVTVSLRAGEETVLEQNMVLHVMLGMWLDDWGMEMSETVAVTQSGAECLTRFPRNVRVID